MHIKIYEITHTSINKASQISSRFFDSAEWQAVSSGSFGLLCKSFKIEVCGKDFADISVDVDESGFYSHFTGYGGPDVDYVNSDDIEEIISALERIINKPCKRLKFYPFVAVGNYSQNSFIQKTTSVLRLTNLSLKKEVLYEIRKAQSRAVSVRRLSSKEDIEDFYKIYNETAERVGSDYRTPISVFHTISQIEGSFILGAFKEGRLIAGSVFLCSAEWSYFWWNASNTEGRSLSANYLVMSEAIAILQRQGVCFLDMASSHSSAIRRFKTLWGAKEMTYFEYSK